MRIVAANANFNAALFFLSQSVSAIRDANRASVLKLKAVIKWS